MSNGVGTIVALFCASTIVAAHAQQVATTDRAEVCATVGGMSYSHRHRAMLLPEERAADFARAGVPYGCRAHYQLDHIISLGLGGADTPANRRPQPCFGPWNCHDKDRLEDELWRRVCRDSSMELARAQSLEMDWVNSYRQFFGDPPSAGTTGAPRTAACSWRNP